MFLTQQNLIRDNVYHQSSLHHLEFHYFSLHSFLNYKHTVTHKTYIIKDKIRATCFNNFSREINPLWSVVGPLPTTQHGCSVVLLGATSCPNVAGRLRYNINCKNNYPMSFFFSCTFFFYFVMIKTGKIFSDQNNQKVSFELQRVNVCWQYK